VLPVEQRGTVMKVAVFLLTIFLVSIYAEDLAINWSKVVPIRSLKQFWDNNDFPEDLRPKDEDFKKRNKTESRIVKGSEVK
jgi:hypothetical protein